jgi:hypothetical protein
MRARRRPSWAPNSKAPSALFASAPVALLLSLALACADDGITRLQPKLAITPEAVELGDTGFGQLARRTVTLSNVGSGALVVSELALVGTGTAAPSGDLALAPPMGAAPWILAPSAELAVGIDHLPRDLVLDRGALRVRSDDPDRPELLVPITQAPAGAPAIVAVPDVDAARVEARTPGGIAARVTSVRFGQVDLGLSARRTLFVVDGGRGNLALQVTAVRIRDANPGLTVRVEPTPPALLAALAADGIRSGVERSLRVDVEYAPPGPGPDVDTALEIASNDPASPILSIPVTANTERVDPPVLRVSPTQLDFGSVAIGQLTSRTVVLENAGGSPLALDPLGIDSSTTTFALEQAPSAVTLAAGQMRSFGVRFAPTVAGRQRAVLRVRPTTPGLAPVEVPLVGERATGPAPCTPATSDPTEPANDICANAVARGPITLQLNGTETRTWSGTMETTTDEDWSLHTIVVDAGCDFVGYQFTARVAWPAGETGEVCLHVGDCTNPERGPRCATGSGQASFFALSGGDLCNASNNAVPVFVRVRSAAPRIACQPYTLTFTAR